MKKALILGISGQDGSYLSRFLLERDYEVIGTSRDAQISSFQNLVRLGTYDKVKLESVSLNDFRSVLQVINKHKLDEVYNLAGQSSVGFVTKRIVNTACRIVSGSKEKLLLGNMAIQRDWSWAPEYVEAMWLMLQQENPDDYVIATGESNTLKDFIYKVFSCLDLKWQDHVEICEDLFRPTDILRIKANPNKTSRKLGWTAEYKMRDVARMMVEEETGAIAGERRGSQ